MTSQHENGKLFYSLFPKTLLTRLSFVNNVAGKMEVCKDKEILKRQIAIFREVSDDIATRLEKATGIKGYDGISNMKFNGTHNGMTKDASIKQANGVAGKLFGDNPDNNGARKF